MVVKIFHSRVEIYGLSPGPYVETDGVYGALCFKNFNPFTNFNPIVPLFSKIKGKKMEGWRFLIIIFP
jgi:hypothetical protein